MAYGNSLAFALGNLNLNGPSRIGATSTTSNGVLQETIRDVWKGNLYDEFTVIRQVVKNFPFIALDTEFPGVVLHPLGEFKTADDYQYQVIRSNCDVLSLIQLGITFMNENGETPPGICTWQFNFKFSLSEDMYNDKSIELLKKSGIQFQRHEAEGIDTFSFAEFCLTSGIILSENVTWIAFHSCYDFGYLLQILMNHDLPETEVEFHEILSVYFPIVYDIKHLMQSCKNLRGGLQDLANQLQVQRVGVQHQAGSDSHITGLVFFRLKELFFEDHIDESKH